MNWVDIGLLTTTIIDLEKAIKAMIGHDAIFTAEINEYVVFTLELIDYRPSKRQIPDAYEILPSTSSRTPYRHKEKELLKRYFRAWRRPFFGKLSGFREDSPVLLCHGDDLVCGVYLCDENQYQRPRWGQLHYAFIEPAHQGKGLYSGLFREVVRRADSWGLSGLILNSDRHLLPEVYERWGAIPYERIHKGVARRIASSLYYRASDLFDQINHRTGQ